ncbi:tetratricopeptide repeat protein [Hufsiella ginkgonis]|uniref:Tetratricopeptide repeat protein n=1 Tax=Hufsiella ginkgonis TaxID=2695274 RepID=A0A7K1Y344_9SPHI|nr:tetratricopeptide repeat protein [Hufsiella ginkgonis]MXV17528.1 hypothetical protein [Hufsiella ginkgonis]
MALSASAAFSQTAADAKKAIDAEQYQKAKGILKKLISAQPAAGENYFYLGQVYLQTDYIDSARATFAKGVASAADYPLNYIGQGAVELETGNETGAKGLFEKAAASASKKDVKPLVYIGRAYTEASKPDFKTAVVYLEKAKALNPKDAEAWLAIGNAHRNLGDNSAAYSDYIAAYDLDKTLIRAKLEKGVSTKMAKAYKEAADEFKAVIALDPNYGPAYRELADTYRWIWNGESGTQNETIKLALQNYEKYMDLTDRSLESRMKHADFLILSKEYKALEAEANEMAKLDKTNPRIFRYLGYAASENGNYPASIQALKDFISKVDSTRLIPRDYLYLGKAQMKTGETVAGFANLKKAILMDSTYAEMMVEIAKGLYDAKKFDEASAAYELAVKNPKAKVTDYLYLSLSYYFDYSTKSKANLSPSKDILVKADSTLSYLNRRAPASADPYIFRARIGRLMDDETAPKGLMVPFYEKFVELTNANVAAKGAATLTASVKNNLLESYNNLGAFYANTDKVKAKEYFDKSVALDPANEYATNALKQLASMTNTPK